MVRSRRFLNKRPFLWWLQQVFCQSSESLRRSGRRPQKALEAEGPRAAEFRKHTARSEQPLSKGAVQSFHDRLVSVNTHPVASNVCVVFFHLFSDCAHELAPRLHLQTLWPFHLPAFENFLNSAPDLSSLLRSRVQLV